MNKELTPIDKFGRCVESIKSQIVFNTKEIGKLIKDCKHAKSENDKNALLAKISEKRKDLECYRLALDDLTYAFVQYRPFYGKKIVAKFGYKTVEGYLADKENGMMPSLHQMMELITTQSHYIPSFYEYTYNEEGNRILNRNWDLVDKTSLNKKDMFQEPLFATREPAKDVHDVRQVANIVSSGSRHR